MKGDLFKNRKAYNQINMKRHVSETDLKRVDYKSEKEKDNAENFDYERRWIMQ